MSDSTSLAAIADRIAICELTATYNRLFDDGDGIGWAATFVPDGELVVVGDVTYAGPGELAGFCHQRAGQFHHLTTDPEIQVVGDTGQLRCSLILFSTANDRAELVAVGRYVDELRRTSRGWRFQRRTVSLTRAPDRSPV